MGILKGSPINTDHRLVVAEVKAMVGQHVEEGRPQDGKCIDPWATLALDKLREFEEPEMTALENDMREAVRMRDFSGISDFWDRIRACVCRMSAASKFPARKGKASNQDPTATRMNHMLRRWDHTIRTVWRILDSGTGISIKQARTELFWLMWGGHIIFY